MGRWLKDIAALCVLVGMIVGGLSYFTTKQEFKALAQTVQQNTDQMNYQTALATYEFLIKLYKKNLNDEDVRRKLNEAEKRVKMYECKLFKQGC